MTESGRVVVAGAGLAGFRTVEELRERGFAGPITLVGAEPRPPYDRPPLSKKFLAEPGLDPSLKADFAALEVDFRPDEAATGLGDELITSRGAYPFDHLVLATGALPVALPGDGRQRFLRTYDDALALRDLLKPVAERPKVFYRGYDVYDPVKLGFKTNVAEEGARKYFKLDTEIPGNGNAGHEFGTRLSVAQKADLIAFLNSL